MQRHRFECYLYATLLLLMINFEIAVNFFAILWEHTSKPLSFLKFLKTTSQYLTLLRNAIMENGEAMRSYLRFLFEVSCKRLLTEKRKNHLGSFEEILSANTID